MLYFIDIIDGRCLNWNVMPLLITRQNDSLNELSENIKLTKKFLATSNYSIHACDADYRNKTNGKSYYELERLLQIMIVVENELNNENSCKHNCDLKTMQSYANHPECKQFFDCQYIHSGYEICFADKNSSSKRYEWFKSDDGYIYGNNRGSCNHTKVSVGSYYRASSANSCDYCLCTCVAKPKPKENIVAALSFREQVTDIHKNMVVVGVRFVKKDYMIHVQVKERQFFANISDSADWKKLENFDYYDDLKAYVRKHNSVNHMLYEGADYGHPEFINFDDVIAPANHVITGVRFRFAEDSFEEPRFKSGSIQLQIRVTPFDYAKGLVNIEKTRWIAPKEVPMRFRKTLGNAMLPTKSPGNVVDSMPNESVRFRPSNLIEDAGQSTVPFFDAQDVEGKPEFPLGGVGLVHRGWKNYGGFLAFRIFDINLSELFKDKSE
ncbi:GSCOCG00007422001-RA-CDS [Cotesia congregata]|nr:GSCOCG00007422001-RA-CDS [Cotesia congregata]